MYSSRDTPGHDVANVSVAKKKCRTCGGKRWFPPLQTCDQNRLEADICEITNMTFRGKPAAVQRV